MVAHATKGIVTHPFLPIPPTPLPLLCLSRPDQAGPIVGSQSFAKGRARCPSSARLWNDQGKKMYANHLIKYNFKTLSNTVSNMAGLVVFHLARPAETCLQRPAQKKIDWETHLSLTDPHPPPTTWRPSAPLPALALLLASQVHCASSCTPHHPVPPPSPPMLCAAYPAMAAFLTFRTPPPPLARGMLGRQTKLTDELALPILPFAGRSSSLPRSWASHATALSLALASSGSPTHTVRPSADPTPSLPIFPPFPLSSWLNLRTHSVYHINC